MVDRVEAVSGAMQTGVSHLHAAVEQTEQVRQYTHEILEIRIEIQISRDVFEGKMA